MNKRGSVRIDLAVGTGMTGMVETSFPATVLNLPKLTGHRYRLYPVVDQIADKVCATLTDYAGLPSGREKDLVDLVVFAVTQDIDGSALSRAIESELCRRNLNHVGEFNVPTTWGVGYRKLSKPVPHCVDYSTVEEAAELASRLVAPALTGEARGKFWSPSRKQWSDGED